MFDSGDLKQTPFCYKVFSQSVMAGQENVLVKCFNNVSFQYVVLTLSVGILNYKQKSILSFNFKPPAFYFVNCSNKGLCKKQFANEV